MAPAVAIPSIVIGKCGRRCNAVRGVPAAIRSAPQGACGAPSQRTRKVHWPSRELVIAHGIRTPASAARHGGWEDFVQIHSLARRTSTADPITRRAPLLIEAVGTACFGERLFQVAREAVRCDHINAFAVNDQSERRMLFAASRRAPLAWEAGTRYLSRHWDKDPANQLPGRIRLPPEGIFVRMTAVDMAANAYRRDLYTAEGWAESGANLIERLSIMRRCDCEVVRIGFYRHKQFGPFTDTEVTIIADATDLLFALAIKHDPVGPGRADEIALQARYQQCLRHAAPMLSRRETEVCACIAAGLNSEAIALELGISLNTVLTHRKHAYARLKISSQNQLLKLIFSAMVQPGH
jgi:DNA-binding CsgD family transcriptional regulator